ncbi:carbohydrate ABC transporter permease [Robinsoniella sp. KNHs210]|uniref:carbohydrate ABC transporter permease n=1 Tax=Robinsoniella sp. KNHs210 TaxID=1469950 RepID=UPI00048340CF|nr:sugar ABC transporter permease [Robinsoniella sp. KNHs210]
MSTLSLEKKYAAASSVAEKTVRKRIPGGIKPYLFLLPAIGLIIFWTYKPLLQTLQYSMYKWSMVPGTVPEYVGFQNFVKLFHNKDFVPALKNTLIYILGMLPFSIVLPLFIAAATQDLNEKAKKIYRAIFFIPMIMAPVAVSIIFQWLMHPSNGLVNHLLQTMGLTGESIAFFADQKFARLMIILISGWKMIGFSTLMFSSALSGFDTQYYEAAKLDGAGSIRRFFDMTLVLLSPTAMLMLMVSVLFSSQWSFAYIDVLTQGGPFATSTNIYYMMYKFAFGDLNVGLCAAAATLFLVLFGIIALTMQRLTKKYAFYDN